jgi:hypothetical protein
MVLFSVACAETVRVVLTARIRARQKEYTFFIRCIIVLILRNKNNTNPWIFGDMLSFFFHASSSYLPVIRIRMMSMSPMFN